MSVGTADSPFGPLGPQALVTMTARPMEEEWDVLSSTLQTSNSRFVFGGKECVGKKRAICEGEFVFTPLENYVGSQKAPAVTSNCNGVAVSDPKKPKLMFDEMVSVGFSRYEVVHDGNGDPDKKLLDVGMEGGMAINNTGNGPIYAHQYIMSVAPDPDAITREDGRLPVCIVGVDPTNVGKMTEIVDIKDVVSLSMFGKVHSPMVSPLVNLFANLLDAILPPAVGGAPRPVALNAPTVVPVAGGAATYEKTGLTEAQTQSLIQAFASDSYISDNDLVGNLRLLNPVPAFGKDAATDNALESLSQKTRDCKTYFNEQLGLDPAVAAVPGAFRDDEKAEFYKCLASSSFVVATEISSRIHGIALTFAKPGNKLYICAKVAPFGMLGQAISN